MTVIEEQAMFRQEQPALDAGAAPERIQVILVTPSFFRLTQVPPQRGRVFGDDAGELGRDTELILSDGLWCRAFGGRDVVGEIVRLNGESHTVVGALSSCWQTP